jgi:hypothetical protein
MTESRPPRPPFGLAVLLLLLAHTSAVNASVPASTEPSIARLDDIRVRLLASCVPPAATIDRTDDEMPQQHAQWPNWPNWPNWGNWGGWWSP